MSTIALRLIVGADSAGYDDKSALAHERANALRERRIDPVSAIEGDEVRS